MDKERANLKVKNKGLTGQITRFFGFFWLPLLLIFIFVIQNHLFNFWLNVSFSFFFVRRSIITAALGLLLFGPAVLMVKKIKYPYLIIVSSLVAFIFIAQFLYFSYFGGFLQASAFFYSSQGLTVLSTVKTLLTYRLLFFLVSPLVVAAVWITISRRRIIEQILSNKEKLFIGIFIVIFSATGYAYLFVREGMSNGNASDLYDFSRLYDVSGLVSKVGIVNFSLGDTLALNFFPQKVSAAEINFVKDYDQGRPTSTPPADFGMLQGRNLILIQVESLENAVINQKIAGQEITPNLNQLAAQGLYFSNYYSPIGPGTTADAEFMTLNSFYSMPDKVAFINYAYDDYEALPGLLKDHGYHTYSFHGDVSSFWNRANIYPQLGYEKWFSRGDYVIPRNIGAFDLGDKDFFAQSIPKLQSLPQPFMATLITISSHSPFQLPDDLETLSVPDDGTFNWLQYEYLESIHYTDQAIGEFIAQLKTAGLYDNSLIMIFGDHGSFTDISTALHFDNGVFPDLQKSEVPMIILAPGTALVGTSTSSASQLDLYPTAADLLGFHPPSDIFGHDLVDGQNLIAVSRQSVSGCVSSVITAKLAYHAGSDGTFAKGTCLSMPDKKNIAVENCQALYDKETKAVDASDWTVKGNLFGQR